MLVLVSFGLVLLATILLVVGLLSDDGLTLIYLSIGASATAAVVLYAAFRMARPKGEKSADAPAPLAEEIAPQPAPEPEPATVAVPASSPSESEAPAEPESPSSSDEWMADSDWDEGDLEFPIADYDDLTVAELMPLLPQLYSDELDTVIERERSGKNRSTIIDRLEELKRVGTDADAEEDAATGVAPSPAAAEPAPAPAPAPAAPARASTEPVLSLREQDEEDDEDLFPIADYDDLSVAQIVPLLSQLEKDELDDVRAREASGAARKTLLAEIDRQLGDEAAASAKKAPAKKSTKKRAAAKKSTKKAPAKKSTKKRAKKAAKRAPKFPIDNYDDLNVADIRPQLTGLSDAELELVREREVTGQGRKTILKEIDSKLS